MIELIYETETDSQTYVYQRTSLWLPKGWASGEG